MEDQEDKKVYLDCIPSFDRESRTYSVDIRLRGEFDEEARRTIEEELVVAILSSYYKIKPILSKFMPSDEGYRNKSVFQICPREGIENLDSKVEVVLLICNEPIHRAIVDIADLLQK